MQPRNGYIKVTTLRAWEGPLVQPLASVAETIVRAFVGPGDESVEGHRHVQIVEDIHSLLELVQGQRFAAATFTTVTARILLPFQPDGMTPAQSVAVS